MHSDDDGRHLSLRWKSGDCIITMAVDGRPVLADDLSGFTKVEGPIRLTQETKGDHRVLDITAGAGGGPRYAYTLNGAGHAFDADARKWLQELLSVLVRQAGFFADQRVSSLLRTGGPGTVLAEVDRLEGDHARRTYLVKLMSQAKLSPAQMGRVIADVDGQIRGDYERASVLMALVDAGGLTDATRSAFIHAAAGIHGDYEKARTLLAPVSRGGLSAADERAIVDASTSIRGSYEKARVLKALAGRKDASAGVITAVIAAVPDVRGDYERASVLVDVAGNHRLDGAQREAYLKAAASIASTYERQRAIRALGGTAGQGQG